MTMSRDRVKFTLNTFALDHKVCTAFTKAFGVPPPSGGGDVTVICRPSQFARFLIYRNEEGARNGFKDLNPVLFTPEDMGTLDVSRNPAR